MFNKLINFSKILPLFILILSIIVGIISNNYKILLFGFLCIFSVIVNIIFKNLIFKNIYNYYGKKKLPVLGFGERPNNCPSLKKLDNIYSEKYIIFGMPSGHIQNMIFISTFWIIYILYNKNIVNINKILYILFLILITIIVILNRLINNYHTNQQIIVGGIIGFIIAIISINIFKNIYFS